MRRSCFPGCPGLGRTLLDPCGALYGQTPQLLSQANPRPGRRCPCCVTTGKSLHLPVVGKHNGSGPAGRNSVSPVWSRGQRLARSKCAGNTTRHQHQLLPPSTQRGVAIIKHGLYVSPVRSLLQMSSLKPPAHLVAQGWRASKRQALRPGTMGECLGAFRHPRGEAESCPLRRLVNGGPATWTDLPVALGRSPTPQTHHPRGRC